MSRTFNNNLNKKLEIKGKLFYKYCAQNMFSPLEAGKSSLLSFLRLSRNFAKITQKQEEEIHDFINLMQSCILFDFSIMENFLN